MDNSDEETESDDTRDSDYDSLYDLFRNLSDGGDDRTLNNNALDSDVEKGVRTTRAKAKGKNTTFQRKGKKVQLKFSGSKMMGKKKRATTVRNKGPIPSRKVVKTLGAPGLSGKGTGA